jgi:hypothetical protein
MTDSFLLAAYPARLRRRHGSELITTMAEAAGPAGPTRADRWQLVADGLRERFRLPPKRPLALVAAVLALLIGGAIGAVAGSWIGMWTYPSVPAAGPLVRQTVGTDVANLQTRHSRLWLQSLSTLAPGLDPAQAVGDARDRLTAAGWKTTPLEVSGGPFHQVMVEAEKSGVSLRMTVHYGADDSMVDVYGYSLRPPTYVPFVLGGLVVGLLAGWLTAAALTYRIAGARRRRVSAVVAGAGLALLLVPAYSIGRYLIAYLPDGGFENSNMFVHRALLASPVSSVAELFGLSWTNVPWMNKDLVIAGLVAAAVAAIIARPGRTGPEPGDAQLV